MGRGGLLWMGHDDDGAGRGDRKARLSCGRSRRAVPMMSQVTGPPDVPCENPVERVAALPYRLSRSRRPFRYRKVEVDKPRGDAAMRELCW